MNKNFANISYKEVVPDMLFSAIFDNERYIDNGRCVVGFIQNHPFVLRYSLDSSLFMLEPCGHKYNIVKHIENGINSNDGIYCEVTDLGNLYSVALYYAE